ncbi:hypothetical protein T05_398 [Trichinella murrelli]|uniref:Uncharacterized protein n=1 Tax=Trichinella murrelli TaxID=144512 RepID=A0A0V0TEL6_9BILA|nr:hypothetical protein T05_398 [Trichinella murrelli]
MLVRNKTPPPPLDAAYRDRIFVTTTKCAPLYSTDVRFQSVVSRKVVTPISIFLLRTPLFTVHCSTVTDDFQVRIKNLQSEIASAVRLTVGRRYQAMLSGASSLESVDVNKYIQFSAMAMFAFSTNSTRRRKPPAFL